jgi:hypothetical protein
MKNMYVLLILWLYLSFSFSICHSQSMNDKEYVKEINRSFPTHPEDTLCIKSHLHYLYQKTNMYYKIS